jgi:integrase
LRTTGKVAPPRRKPNHGTRTREYLTPAEMETLLESAASGRWGHRDRTLLLLMYRHGLRVSETISLRWEQFDLKAGLLSVQRLKHGVPLDTSAARPRTARSSAAASRLAR